jgi:cell division protein FtsI (penicillin-binding protein 3)
MSEHARHPGRVLLVIGLIVLWTAAIGARLAQLQILEHQQFALLALQRQLMTRSVVAPRGIIYDSHMDELATSITVHTVVAEPRRISNIESVAARLASILGLDRQELTERLKDPQRQSFQVVSRRIDPKDEPRIEALDADGVYLVEESMRVYPNRSLASNALGFVNHNGDGGAGIELEYDRELRGSHGQISFNVDARRRSFRGTVERAPVQGHSLVLSLDRSIQYIAERELEAGIKKTGAAAGVAIVMESETGRILALAVHPDFNGNTYNEAPPDHWRNRAVSDMFEPGSTFKVVVASAALEAGLTRPDELIDCQMGSIIIGGHIFHDHKPYGLLTFPEILENSSNVGAAKLGLRLGEERLYEALRTFGFGAKTRVDLPGEIIGLVRDWHRWSKLSIGAISFGQEVGVTPIQMLVAINSIANGGFRVRPSLVDRVIDPSGELLRARALERTRIMSTETAAAVREAFEGVVLRGTGKAAQLEGYRAAGKTGTAQKIIDGRYSNTRYVASFIGFAPLPRPRLTVSVLIDEPHGKIYGGEVAAPIFQKITQEALLQLRLPPDKTLPLPKINPALARTEFEDFLPNATPVVPLRAETDTATDAPEVLRVRVGTASIAMPDFSGMAKRSVIARCQELGLQVVANGSGIAVFQTPPPGRPIATGETCGVTFARAPSARRIPGAVEATDTQTADAAAVIRR